MTTDHHLCLMTFPQRAHEGRLTLRLLTVPTRNPLDPLGSGLPAFADAALTLRVATISGLDDLPRQSLAVSAGDIAPASPVPARDVLEALTARMTIDPTPPMPTTTNDRVRFRKLATASYLDTVGSQRRGSPYLLSAEEYICAIRDSVDPANRPPAVDVPASLTWNQLLARAMRQPLLARAIGLVHEIEVPMPSEGFFDDGGWVWVEPRPASPLAAWAGGDPGLVRSYAARIPPLAADPTRQLFAAVLFPVQETPPPGPYDEIFAEAGAYDDGFAKVVHCFQPARHDPFDVARGGPDGLLPVQDGGIRLGWDDEQVLEWLNRQVLEDPRSAGAAATRDAPVGTLGYRVDVRSAPADGGPTGAWTSLVRTAGELTIDGTDLGRFDGEMAVELLPTLHRSTGGAGAAAGEEYWLAPYATRWAGGSLLAADAVGQALADKDPDRRALRPLEPEDVVLRYGRSYEFRVRLMDLAGGGPGVSDRPLNIAPHRSAVCHVRRFSPPKDLRSPEIQEITGQRLVALHLFRPLLGHPDVLYVDHPNAVGAMLADIPVAKDEGREPGLPDPDATMVRIDITVGSLQGDSANQPGVSPRQPLHTWPLVRQFPTDPSEPLELLFRFVDVSSPEDVATPAADGEIQLPSSRDVFLALTPIARPDPAMERAGAADPALVGDPHRRELTERDQTLEYFGTQAARVGMTSKLSLREPATDEAELISDGDVRAILLAPTAGLPGRLADELGLDVDGVTFRARPGTRTVMAAASRLPHTVPADRGSLRFGTESDLADRWLVAVRVRLARDWTWDGLDALAVVRELDGQEETVTRFALPRTVAAAVVSADVDRSGTDVLVLDVLERTRTEREVSYRVEPLLRHDAPAGSWSGQLRLPAALAPVDKPEIISTGYLQDDFVHDPAYSSTAPRQRYLWVELAAAPDDPSDGVFCRVLAWAPDPALQDVTPLTDEPEEPPLRVPDEPTRVIVPGQSDDRAGADAMQPLIPTDTPRVFLVPVPAGGDPSRRLGFYTYEMRVGHGPGRWSTARARYGPPTRIVGLQHPPPLLECRPVRRPDRLLVTAPFARIDVAEHPAESRADRRRATELWFLLYVQVPRADGASKRNVLLSRRRGDTRREEGDLGTTPSGTAVWPMIEIHDMLAALALPPQAALSALAVEVFDPLDAIDPVSADLGEVRLLRASPLIPVPSRCIE